MPASELLDGIIEEYAAACKEAAETSRPGDGLFGLGDDPRRRGFHTEFYQRLEAAVGGIVSSQPDREEAYGVACVLLKASTEREAPEMARWTLISVQKLAIPLIPLMSDAQRNELKTWYDHSVPRRERLPVQRDVYRLLSSRG